MTDVDEQGRPEPPPAADEADPDWEWHTAADDTPDQIVTLWQDAVARSRELAARAMVDGGLDRFRGRSAPGLRHGDHPRGPADRGAGYRVDWDEEHTVGARFRGTRAVELCGSVLEPGHRSKTIPGRSVEIGRDCRGSDLGRKSTRHCGRRP